MVDHAHLGYVVVRSSQRMAMLELASNSSSSRNHSLRTSLHLWTPEPEHQILFDVEESVSLCAA